LYCILSCEEVSQKEVRYVLLAQDKMASSPFLPPINFIKANKSFVLFFSAIRKKFLKIRALTQRTGFILKRNIYPERISFNIPFKTMAKLCLRSNICLSLTHPKCSIGARLNFSMFNSYLNSYKIFILKGSLTLARPFARPTAL
jgi:hypothetical protein